jgi:hypothetical protein
MPAVVTATATMVNRINKDVDDEIANEQTIEIGKREITVPTS